MIIDSNCGEYYNFSNGKEIKQNMNEGKKHEYEGFYLQVDLHTGPES